MIKIKEIRSYKNFGTCLSLTNEFVKLYVTIDVGPRIIYLSYNGYDNMLYTDANRLVHEDVSSFYSENDTWYLYGGHRLCVAPHEFPKTYYPDNEKVVYEYFSNGVILTPAIQKITGLAYTITITLDEKSPNIYVEHAIKNTNTAPVTIAASSLTVMDNNGTLLIPLNDEDTGFSPNNHIALWPNTKFTDKRLYLGSKFLGFTHDSNIENNYRLSVNNVFGKIAYINHNQALVMEFDFDESKIYPNFNTNSAFCACKDYLEIESLSPICSLNKDEVLNHKETWSLYKDVEQSKLNEKYCEKLAKVLFR